MANEKKAPQPRVYAAGEFRTTSEQQPELHERIVKIEATVAALRSAHVNRPSEVAARLADDVLPAVLNFAAVLVAKVGNVEAWIANLDERLDATEDGGLGIDPEDGQVIIDGLVALAAVAKSFDLEAIGEENAKVVRDALAKGERALAVVQEYLVDDEDEDEGEDDEEAAEGS